MKHLFSFSALCLISVGDATAIDGSERFRVTSFVRGGGIFSDVVKKRAFESPQLKEKAEKTASELDEAAIRVKEEAKKRAEKELRTLEKEARRLANEAEQAARNTARELEKAATAKAAEVAAELEKAALKRLSMVETLFKKKAKEVEKMSIKKAADLEKGVRHYIAPKPKKRLLNLQAVHSLYGLLIIVASLTAITNLLGWPPQVLNHWENTVFGEKFFSFEWGISKKRMLAGAMEASAVLMMLNAKARKLGTGLIGLMYTHAAIISAQLDLWKMALVGSGAVVAWLLLANAVFF